MNIAKYCITIAHWRYNVSNDNSIWNMLQNILLEFEMLIIMNVFVILF